MFKKLLVWLFGEPKKFTEAEKQAFENMHITHTDKTINVETGDDFPFPRTEVEKYLLKRVDEEIKNTVEKMKL